jgi:hypothetical protein
MKKRPFLLLEILIAFFLVAICAVPLVRQPLKLYRSEMSQLERMEKERLADWTFIEIKEKLLKNEIPWEKIPGKGVTSAPFSLPDASIEIPGCPPKKVHREFFLTGRGEKVGMNEEIYRQLGVYVYLDKQKYSFRLPIQKTVYK